MSIQLSASWDGHWLCSASPLTFDWLAELAPKNDVSQYEMGAAGFKPSATPRKAWPGSSTMKLRIPRRSIADARLTVVSTHMPDGGELRSTSCGSWMRWSRPKTTLSEA